jgi:hypothetical protein
MEKLAKLSSKEESGEQNLSGLFRITMDVHVTADKTGNVEVLKELAKVMGDVEDITIERVASESPFSIGDEIELTSEYTCDKNVYQDSCGNLFISDKPTEGSVEKIGVFRVSLPAGTVAEVNKKSVDGSIEVLFTGESIYLDDISRIAYLGILALPTHLLAK